MGKLNNVDPEHEKYISWYDFLYKSDHVCFIQYAIIIEKLLSKNE